uniref:Transmembrane protein n=1 Tax=Bionectria ochroleuca TaxID=29856 RepID=A0A8H7NQW1_BIOOC
MASEDKYFYASLVFLALALVAIVPYGLLAFMKLRAASKSARSGLLWIRATTVLVGVWIAIWLAELSIATHVQVAGPTPYDLRASLYHLEGVKTLIGFTTFASIVYTELELVITLEDTDQTPIYRYFCWGVYGISMMLNMARFVVYEVALVKPDVAKLGNVSEKLELVIAVLIAVFSMVGVLALMLYRMILHETDFIVLALAYGLTFVRQLVSVVQVVLMDTDGHKADDFPLDGNWRRLVDVLIIGWTVVASVAMIYTVVAKNTESQYYDGASDTASLCSRRSDKSFNCKDSVTWDNFSAEALEKFKADVQRNSMNRSVKVQRTSMLRESMSHRESMQGVMNPNRNSIHHKIIKS